MFKTIIGSAVLSMLLSGSVIAVHNLEDFEVVTFDSTEVFTEEATTEEDTEESTEYSGEMIDNIIAVDDIGIVIDPKVEFSIIIGSDNFTYLYTLKENSIPYVLMGKYNTQYSTIINDFSNYMRGIYDDLTVVNTSESNIGGRVFKTVEYEYELSGYRAKDVRYFYDGGKDTVYMFGSKEISKLDLVLPDGFLNSVLENISFVDDLRPYIMHASRSEYLYATVNIDDSDESEDEEDTTSIEIVKEKPTKAVAEEHSTSEEIKETSFTYPGYWREFNEGYKIYLPEDWNEYIPQKELINEGVAFLAGGSQFNGRNTDNGIPFLSISFTRSEDIVTLDDAFNYLFITKGYYTQMLIDYWDIPYISFEPMINYGDFKGVAFLYPGDNEKYQKYYLITIVANNYSKDSALFDEILRSLRK